MSSTIEALRSAIANAASAGIPVPARDQLERGLVTRALVSQLSALARAQELLVEGTGPGHKACMWTSGPVAFANYPLDGRTSFEVTPTSASAKQRETSDGGSASESVYTCSRREAHASSIGGLCRARELLTAAEAHLDTLSPAAAMLAGVRVAGIDLVRRFRRA